MNESRFFESAYRIINKYNAATKRPRAYGENKIQLYSAETHMIEVIGGEGRITTTQLAKNMAITKGAVSQTTTKLLKKGLIEKIAMEENPHAFYVVLTEEGKAVFDEHRRFHKEMTDRVDAVISTMSDEEKSKLDEILNTLDEILDSYE